ncbi:MAG: hypothetical protein M1814_005301 [Vezdaea aestivalis]|nr:MAG: hypothetical protein M1814_005301 [Vezdaea aestivalis]
MHSQILSLVALALAGTSLAATIPNDKRTLPSTSGNQDIINRLTLAGTAVERIAILTNDRDFTYDFLNPPTQRGNSTGRAGRTINANRATFPGLIGSGSSMTVGFLDACGMNTPHTHPRGTELNIVVRGRLRTTVILENGARVIENTNTLYQMNVFPQGAMHQEFNPDCEPAVFIAGFNNEDAGTQQTADTLFRMQSDVLRASFGGELILDGRNLDAFKSQIPANVARGVQECLTKCNIRKRSLDEISRLDRLD